MSGFAKKGSTAAGSLVAAPKTLRYEHDGGLPVAIEAKSNRRAYVPNNGSQFSPGQTIRINLNSSSFIDFSHSYLQFKFFNKTDGVTDRSVGLDMGCPFFSRLQIMSGGQELEDISEYSRLYAILESIQGSRLNADEHSLTEHENFTPNAADVDAQANTNAAGYTAAAAGNAAATLLNDAISGQINAAVDGANPYVHPPNTNIAHNNSRVFNVPLVSAIFNIEKYFPLLLTQQGIDIYLTLNSAADIGAWSGAVAANQWEISEVKYVAHEVNLDDMFTNQMKMSIQATGGVLSLASTTYKHYLVNQSKANIGSATHNVSTQVKSLKGLIVRPQNNALTGDIDRFAISTGQSMGINEIQFKVGSVMYPQEAIKFSADNAGEMYNEIRKCFGTIGSYNHGTMLNKTTFTPTVDAVASYTPGAGNARQLFVAAYDFETFAKSATESGLNTSDRSLPVSFTVKTEAVNNVSDLVVRYDVFAMADCILYINLAGKLSTRI